MRSDVLQLRDTTDCPLPITGGGHSRRADELRASGRATAHQVGIGAQGKASW
ncbi:MAG TPA: hypothetical protein VLY63_03585 [Anaerolineae bacterium]|nr:hypothetical protein [Anaerolineae bacterium]